MLINVEKLLADYSAERKALEVEVKANREELEERLEPFIRSGTISADQVEELAAGLTVRLEAQFSAKWREVDATPYLVAEPPVEVVEEQPIDDIVAEEAVQETLEEVEA